jgi:hypothetical protein
MSSFHCSVHFPYCLAIYCYHCQSPTHLRLCIIEMSGMPLALMSGCNNGCGFDQTSTIVSVNLPLLLKVSLLEAIPFQYHALNCDDSSKQPLLSMCPDPTEHSSNPEPIPSICISRRACDPTRSLNTQHHQIPCAHSAVHHHHHHSPSPPKHHHLLSIIFPVKHSQHPLFVQESQNLPPSNQPLRPRKIPA